MENKIKDSGEMREFASGAHRDAAEGKGRMDLVPYDGINAILNCSTETESGLCCDDGYDGSQNNDTLNYDFKKFLMESFLAASKYLDRIEKNPDDKDDRLLARAARAAVIAIGLVEGPEDGVDVSDITCCIAYGIKQVSIHYEAGALKYGANNWKKGIPITVLLDSGMRHSLKAVAGITDEPHCRAAAWNFLCAIWTVENGC